jgi:hypothetical protein
VTIVVKEDEITAGVDVGLLRLETEALEPDRLIDLIEQAGGLGLRGIGSEGDVALPGGA